MCGLVGIAGNITTPHKKVFRDMLIFDCKRGMDSTGVAAINLKDEVKIDKVVGAAPFLWQEREEKDTLFNDKGLPDGILKGLLGHNRYATMGTIDIDTAHPFKFGDITGTHNGTLTQWWDLEGYVENETDSQSLIQTINAKGIEHTWKNFKGAAAIVWWNEKESTLNLIRNSKRPLHYTYNKNKTVLYYASEFWMIKQAVAGVTGTDLEEGKDKESVVNYEVKENKHYKFKVTAGGVETPTITDIDPSPDQTKDEWEINYGMGAAMYNPTIGIGHNSSTNHKSHHNKNVSYPDKDAPLSYDYKWADGLPKETDKTVRGNILTFKNKYFKFVNMFHNDKKIEYLSLKFQNEEKWGQHVQVFFSTEKEYKYFKETVDRNPEVKFKLMAKPRIHSTILKDDKQVPTVYRVGARNIRVVLRVNTETQKKDSDDELREKVINLYVGRSGNVVNEATMTAHMFEAGNSCCYCGDPLSVKDHGKTIQWMSKTNMMCKDCYDDPEKQEIAKQCSA